MRKNLALMEGEAENSLEGAFEVVLPSLDFALPLPHHF
jgi:hypothetical protein